MNKIVIIGPAGSGKSTLSRKIASKTRAAYLELDSINHQADWQPIDKNEFRKIVNKFTQGSSWIIDGNYLSSIGMDAWKRADTVIWLDHPFFVVFTRLVFRTLQRTLRRVELWNGNKESFIGNFFTKDSVIYFMVHKWKSQKRKYSKIFHDSETFPGVELIRLKSDRDVRNFMERVR